MILIGILIGWISHALLIYGALRLGFGIKTIDIENLHDKTAGVRVTIHYTDGYKISLPFNKRVKLL